LSTPALRSQYPGTFQNQPSSNRKASTSTCLQAAMMVFLEKWIKTYNMERLARTKSTHVSSRFNNRRDRESTPRHACRDQTRCSQDITCSDRAVVSTGGCRICFRGAKVQGNYYGDPRETKLVTRQLLLISQQDAASQRPDSPPILFVVLWEAHLVESGDGEGLQWISHIFQTFHKEAD
jgi:hypothetical protein